eukprot:400985-Prorocentrum_minimum.AAC.1
MCRLGCRGRDDDPENGYDTSKSDEEEDAKTETIEHPDVLKLVKLLSRIYPPNKREDEGLKTLVRVLRNFSAAFRRLPLAALMILAQQVEIISCPAQQLVLEEVCSALAQHRVV